MSFALDYDKEDGNPDSPQTAIGVLRSQAKPYNKLPTPETYSAADKLAEKCAAFIKESKGYKAVDGIIPVPPREGKQYDLPTYIVNKISTELGIENLSEMVKSNGDRRELKNVPLLEKLTELEGTIEIVEPGNIRGRNILIIDDIYQSGVTMNYVGMLLMEAGATRLFGLSCEKTCSNDDNVSRR